MYWRTKLVLGMNPLYIVEGIAPLYVIWYHIANSKKFLAVKGSGMIVLFYLSSMMSFAVWYFKSPEAIHMSLTTVTKVISAFCLFFIIPHVFQETKDVKRFIVILALSVLVVYAVTGFEYVTGDFGVGGGIGDSFYIESREGFTRMSDIYEGTYDLAYCSFYTIIISTILLPWIKRKSILRVLVWGCMLVALYVLFRTYVRVAWAMLGFVPILFYAVNKKVLKALAVSVLVGVLFFSSGLVRTRLGDEVGVVKGNVEVSRVGTSRASTWVEYWNQYRKGDTLDKILGRRGLGNPDNQLLYLLGYFGILGTLVFHIMIIYISFLLFKSFSYFMQHPHDLFTRYSQFAFLFFVSFFLFADLGMQQLTVVGSQWVIFSVASISIYQWQSHKRIRERMIDVLEVRMAKMKNLQEAVAFIEPGEEEFYQEVEAMFQDRGHMPGSETEDVDFSRDAHELAAVAEMTPLEDEATFTISREVLFGLGAAKEMPGRVFRKLKTISDIAFHERETPDAVSHRSHERSWIQRWVASALIAGIILGGASLYYSSRIGMVAIEGEEKQKAATVEDPDAVKEQPSLEKTPREETVAADGATPSIETAEADGEAPVLQTVVSEKKMSPSIQGEEMDGKAPSMPAAVPRKTQDITREKPGGIVSRSKEAAVPPDVQSMDERLAIPSAWRTWTRQSLSDGILLRATIGSSGEIRASVERDVSEGLIGGADADSEQKRREALFDYSRYVYVYVLVGDFDSTKTPKGHPPHTWMVLKDSVGTIIDPLPWENVPHGEEISMLVTGPPGPSTDGRSKKAGGWLAFPVNRIHPDISFIQLVVYDDGLTTQRTLVWRIGGAGG